MDIAYHHDCTRVDWQELALVIERAPLGKRDPVKTRISFTGSFVACFATDGKKLVGAGRAISDGIGQAAIYDVVILPEYQGRKIGSELIRRLMEKLPGQAVLLVSVPAKEGFYAKHGFRRLRTAMINRPNPQAWIDAGYYAD